MAKLHLQVNQFEFENRVEALHRWYEVYAYHIGQPESRKVAILFNDITEHKQLEEQTRLRAEELATVMETTPIAIWIGHDPQSHNITGNRMANKFYEAEVGENVSANITPVRRFFCKDRELTADELPMQEASLNDIDVRNVELDVLLPSGKRRVILGSASPLHDADGHVRGSIGAFIDITKRKRMEEALHHSEEKYRSIVELANEGVWVTDTETKTLYVNEKMAEMLGYSHGEMIDKRAMDFVDKNHKAYAELRMEKRRQGIDEVHENKLVRKDGSTLWALVNSKSLFNKDGKFTGILAMVTDVTERKQADEALRQAYENLQMQSEELQAQSEEIQMQYEELQTQSEELHEANEALRESEERSVRWLMQSRSWLGSPSLMATSIGITSVGMLTPAPHLSRWKAGAGRVFTTLKCCQKYWGSGRLRLLRGRCLIWNSLCVVLMVLSVRSSHAFCP